MACSGARLISPEKDLRRTSVHLTVAAESCLRDLGIDRVVLSGCAGDGGLEHVQSRVGAASIRGLVAAQGGVSTIHGHVSGRRGGVTDVGGGGGSGVAGGRAAFLTASPSGRGGGRYSAPPKQNTDNYIIKNII